MITAGGQAKLLDFGLARRLDSEEIESISKSRQSLGDLRGFAGTLCYMAPEVLRGKPADARSDLWSLGALLYETLSGRLPFKGETPFELTLAIMVESPPPLPPGVPPALRACVAKSLEKDLQKRYASTDDLRAALQLARAELDESRHPSLLRAKAPAVAGLAAVLALGLALVVRGRGRRAAAPTPAQAVVQTEAPSAKPASGPPSAQPGTPKSGRSVFAANHTPQRTRSSGGPLGNPDIEVWANSKSKVYHCPGSRWYRHTANGELIKQRQAQANGYHPAGGLACP